MSDAKALTTADVGLLQPHTSEDGGFPGVVLVDRDDLLATTRALETAQRDALEAQGSEEGLVRELNSAQDRALARLRERDEAQARAEKAEAERDKEASKAQQYESDWRAAKSEFCTAAAKLRDRIRASERETLDAVAELDAARARVAELETALGDSARSRDWPCLDCQPESPDKASLKTLVSGLVKALTDALEWMEGRFGNPAGLDWGDESAAAVADALDAALAKAKGAKP